MFDHVGSLRYHIGANWCGARGPATWNFKIPENGGFPLPKNQMSDKVRSSAPR